MKITTPIYFVLSTFMIGSYSSAVLAGEKVDKQLKVESNIDVEIENVRGKVAIEGWNKNTVSVVGELDDKTEQFIFEKRGNDVVIKVKTPNKLNHDFWGAKGKGSNLVIKLPQQARVEFSGVSTDVIVSDLHQRTEIKTVSGDIDAKKLSKITELATVSGEINSQYLSGKNELTSVSGDIHDSYSTGRMSMESVSGNLTSESTANVVSAHTVSGDLRLILSKIDELELNTVSGSAEAKFSLNEDGSVDSSSVSGDVDLLFQQKANATFRLVSNAGGSIVNKITADKAKRAKYGPGEKLRFSVGNSNASVEVSTVSGDITVAKQ